MERKTYDEALDLAQRDLSPLLRQKVRDLFKTSKVAGQSYRHMVADVSPASCAALINDYCSGNLAYRIYNLGSTRTVKNMKRVAMLYELLGLDKDDKIVELTKQINPELMYPLPLTLSLEGRCNVQVNFKEEGLFITPNQQSHLERLAAMYASQNKKQ